MKATSKMVIGVDEVGMGSLAGPVVVCAVQAPRHLRIGNFGVHDSKQLTPKQRETVAHELVNSKKLKYQIAYAYPKTIDKINIFQASRKAMARAIAKIQNPNTKNQMVLIDGPYIIKNLKLPQQAIIRGDRTVFAIAAASILAKVYRDNMMRNYAKRFPEYGFERHKGYGTKLHYAMLYQHGPCKLHRKSFILNHDKNRN